MAKVGIDRNEARSDFGAAGAACPLSWGAGSLVRLKIDPAPLPRFLTAALAGAMWGLAFPRPGIAGFAWAVPGILLAATGGTPPGLAFRLGYTSGAVAYLISLSWLRHIPFPAGAYAGWFALSLFLALFPAFWVSLAWHSAVRLRLLPGDSGSLKGLADHFLRAPWLRLNLWFMATAAAWVAWEMVQARLFGGFPWNLLGASQYRMLPLVQIASVTGVYGVSFVMVWFSTALFAATLLLLRDPDHPGTWRRPLLFPALMIVALTGGGFLTLLAEAPSTRKLTVSLVQPAIPQTVIFDPASTAERFEALLRLTDQALATRPDLVVWPEASLPGGLSPEDFQRLVRSVRNAGASLIFGADDAEPATPTEPVDRTFNAAFLLGPDGQVRASYRKRRLVMFGEYIPFSRWFPFLQKLAPIGDGFQPGTEPVAFRFGEAETWTASPLICFEDNFPHQAREHAAPGIELLVNLTNDGWFGQSSAQWQHLANAVFRAVENGIPLIRATNNGISAWVDTYGRIHSPRLAAGRDVYEAGFDTLTVRAPQGGRRTMYNRVGDLFGWACVILTAGWIRPAGSRSRPSGADGSAVAGQA